MTTTAFLLINSELGAEKQLVDEIKSIQHVKEAHLVYGVYDIVTKVEADTMDEVKETITWKIRKLDRVKSTLTMMVVESYGSSP